MDKLKRHIEKNQAELEQIEQPNLQKIWNGIQKDLAKPKENFIRKSTRPKKLQQLTFIKKESKRLPLWAVTIAASMALLIGVGAGYWMKAESSPLPAFNLANYAPELAQQATIYQQLVHQKMTEINMEDIDNQEFAEIFKELKELDAEYENWTKDVPQYVHQQELIEFLQRHYEQKIRILEILSNEIEKKAHNEERAIKL